MDEERHRWEGVENRRHRRELAFKAALEIDYELPAIDGGRLFVKVFSTYSAVIGDAARLDIDLFNGADDEYCDVNHGGRRQRRH